MVSLPIVGRLCTSRPGWSIGIRKSERPSCFGLSGSVRAPTQYQSAKCAEVVQIFWPLSCQPPSTFSALQLHVRRVGARLGLAVADGELDLGVQDLRQELALQLLAAVADQRLADDAHALADLRGRVARQRLVQDVLVDALDLLAAVLLRPGHAEPALGGELLHEGAALGRVHELAEVLAGGIHHDGVVVLDQPGSPPSSANACSSGENSKSTACSFGPGGAGLGRSGCPRSGSRGGREYIRNVAYRKSASPGRPRPGTP